MTDEDAVFTLAVVLSAAGAVVGAAFVTGLVQLLKNVLPLNGKERVTAFVIAAVLVILAYGSTTFVAQPPAEVTLIGAFGAFLAWYNIARLSMAHYDDLTRQTNSLTGPEG
jgi:hypothetical protein